MKRTFNTHRATTQHSMDTTHRFDALAQADGEYFTEIERQNLERKEKAKRVKECEMRRLTH